MPLSEVFIEEQLRYIQQSEGKLLPAFIPTAQNESWFIVQGLKCHISTQSSADLVFGNGAENMLKGNTLFFFFL